MRKVSIPFVDMMRPFLAGTGGLLLLACFLLYRLGNLTNGFSAAEAPTVSLIQGRALGLERILENSLFLPHKLGIYIVEKTGLTSLSMIRSVGVLFGLAAATAIYLILKKWHTRRIAIFGTILFVTSSWFLHAARTAVPETSYLLLPVFLYAAIKLDDGESRFRTVLGCFLITALMLYIPGMVWFVIGLMIWQRRKIVERLQEVNPLGLMILAFGTMVALAPLAYTFYSHPDLIKVWAGYNLANLNVIAALKDFAQVPFQIFVKASPDASVRLGRLPYLDAATVVFCLLGVYWYVSRRGLDRARVLLAGTILSFVLIALYGPPAEAIALPFIYLAAAAGVTVLLRRWFTVFPRNPLARGIGIGLLVITVGMIAFYHTQKYFVAWPNTPATKAAFSIDP